MDTFRKFDQLVTGCWLFNAPIMALRAEKRFNDEVLNGYAMSVEGLYTKQHEGGRFNGKDIFGAKYATLFIDGQFVRGVFNNMNEVKTRFCINANFLPTMITILPVRFSNKNDLSVLVPLNGEPSKSEQYSHYTFCINTVLSDLDVMAAKLVTE